MPVSGRQRLTLCCSSAEASAQQLPPKGFLPSGYEMAVSELSDDHVNQNPEALFPLDLLGNTRLLLPNGSISRNDPQPSKWEADAGVAEVDDAALKAETFSISPIHPTASSAAPIE